jgi:hypothetical protein
MGGFVPPGFPSPVFLLFANTTAARGLAFAKGAGIAFSYSDLCTPNDGLNNDRPPKKYRRRVVDCKKMSCTVTYPYKHLVNEALC